jgi:pimeloyl-ACP methyl ester carboxylesterase
LDAYARALLGLLDQRGVSDCSVVGLSLGGYVAMALLALAPERIRVLVLADTRAAGDTDEARAGRRAVVDRVKAEGSVECLVESTVERLLAPTQADEAHIADPVRGRVRRWTPSGVAAAQRAMSERPDRTALMGSIATPTLVIAGSEDTSTPPDSMRELASAIPGARFQLIEGAGHLSNLEKPFAFTDALVAFLSNP